MKNPPCDLDVIMVFDFTMMDPEVHKAFCAIGDIHPGIRKIELHRDGSVLVYGEDGFLVSIAPTGAMLSLDEAGNIHEIVQKTPTHDEFESAYIH